MFPKSLLLALSFTAAVLGQQVGTNMAETHPSLTWQKCTAPGSCSNVQGKVVLDANWRWTHRVNDFTNCYTGNTWDTSICPDGTTCAQNCALDGADYAGTYGVTSSGSALTLKFITQSAQKNIGSRLYLMADDSNYQMFNLLGQEFTFDVDVSKLPCGLNGALYFSEMAKDGGMSANSGNKAGAKYGTGYCDSQCPRDIKFINGVANSDGWEPSPSDSNAGTGNFGACCSEMDIWEANSISSAVTPHPCQQAGLVRCSGNTCSVNDRYATECDPDGCDFNSFRMGDKTFYGPGMTVDTTKPITVVTQFVTDSGSTSGNLQEIRRIYVQNGKVIQNSNVNVPGMDAGNSITADYCDQAKAAFGDEPSFQNKGGLSGMSKALGRGMVLVLSIWDDHAVNMLWLDSNYPTDASASQPGIARGTCSTSSGSPPDVEANGAGVQVIYSNIKFGPIGSTFNSNGSSTSTGGGSPTTTSNTAAQTMWGQCGGQGWTGPTACQSPATCHVVNDFYSQCF